MLQSPSLPVTDNFLVVFLLRFLTAWSSTLFIGVEKVRGFDGVAAGGKRLVCFEINFSKCGILL